MGRKCSGSRVGIARMYPMGISRLVKAGKSSRSRTSPRRCFSRSERSWIGLRSGGTGREDGIGLLPDPPRCVRLTQAAILLTPPIDLASVTPFSRAISTTDLSPSTSCGLSYRSIRSPFFVGEGSGNMQEKKVVGVVSAFDLRENLP